MELAVADVLLCDNLYRRDVTFLLLSFDLLGLICASYSFDYLFHPSDYTSHYQFSYAFFFNHHRPSLSLITTGGHAHLLAFKQGPMRRN